MQVWSTTLYTHFCGICLPNIVNTSLFFTDAKDILKSGKTQPLFSGQGVVFTNENIHGVH